MIISSITEIVVYDCYHYYYCRTVVNPLALTFGPPAQRQGRPFEAFRFAEDNYKRSYIYIYIDIDR